MLSHILFKMTEILLCMLALHSSLYLRGRKIPQSMLVATSIVKKAKAILF